MSYLISFCGSLLLTSLTGSIALLVWYILSWALDYTGSYRMRCLALTAVAVCFLFPATAIIVLIIASNYIRWGGYLFLGTGLLYASAVWFLRIWLCGMTLVGAWHLHEGRRLKRLLDQHIPCEKAIKAQVDEITTSLYPGKPPTPVYRSYRVQTPLLYGIWKPMILLPVRHYSPEELRVILTHELVHHGQKANLLKRLVLVVLTVHWFNPLVWFLSRQVLRWTELSCDEAAAVAVSGRRLYYETIEKLVEKNTPTGGLMASSLGEKGCSMEERFKRAVMLQRKGKKLWAAIVSAVLMVAIGTVSVMGSTEFLANAYVWAWHETVVEIEVPQPELPEVFTAYSLSENVQVEMDNDTILLANTWNTIDWTVNNNIRKTSGLLFIQAGKTVSIVGSISPSGRTVRMGLQAGSNEYKYVYVSGNVFAQIEVDESAYYRFFIENTSGTTITTDLVVYIN